MKKKILALTICLGAATFSYGQVGVNTENALSTFDITAQKPIGKTTDPEGLLMPRIDRERAQSMVGVKTSTMVYITSALTGTQAGTARFIDQNGFYSYDEVVSAWIKVTPPAPIVPEPIPTSYILMYDTVNPGQIAGYGWNEPLNSQNPSIYKDFTIPVGTLNATSGAIEFRLRTFRSQGLGVWATNIMLSEDGGTTWPDYFSWSGSGGEVVVSGTIFFNDGKLTLLTSAGNSYTTTTISNTTKAVTFRLAGGSSDLISRVTIDYARFVLIK